MREGGRLYCRCCRHTCKVCIDQRLAATEATCTGPCSALLPQDYKTLQKSREKDYTASCGACRELNTGETEKERIKRRMRKGEGGLHWLEERREG